jgi:hypothetical protein
MRVIVGVVEAIAVLVPDFRTLGLVVPASFSLFCCAISLGLVGSRDTNATLWISFVLGYVVAVALNLASALIVPARPRPFSSSYRERKNRELPRELQSEAVKTQFACDVAEIRQAPRFLRKVQQ